MCAKNMQSPQSPIGMHEQWPGTVSLLECCVIRRSSCIMLLFIGLGGLLLSVFCNTPKSVTKI